MKGDPQVDQVVEVEARVDVVCRSYNIVPYVTTLLVRRWSGRKLVLGRKSQALLHESSITARVGTFVGTRNKGVVETNNAVILVQGSNSRSFNDDVVLVDRRIDDLNALQVVILGILALQHVVCNIRL